MHIPIGVSSVLPKIDLSKIDHSGNIFKVWGTLRHGNPDSRNSVISRDKESK